MPTTLAALCKQLDLSKTSVVLGAGSSIPSGAPSAKELAHRLWRDIAQSEPLSDDLTESASLLERRFGRRKIIDFIIGVLNKLSPSGGVEAFPALGITRLYTTNFDRIIEKSYQRAKSSLVPVRSNFDFSNIDPENSILYKLHGCVTQDRSLGDKASMILTEGDYEEFSKYRQVLFNQLTQSLLTADVLIIGQSLRDPHLASLIREVLSAQNEGAPGRIFLLVYDRDDVRAPLWEDRGVGVVFGSLDEFVHSAAAATEPLAPEQPVSEEAVLPIAIIASTTNVADEKRRPANVVRMFNGGPATYADIASGATFERRRMNELVAALHTAGAPVITIVGAAGVGKTSFARQILAELQGLGLAAFEHKADFPLNHQAWLSTEGFLRRSGRRGVLLIDECTSDLRSANMIINGLAGIEASALSIVLTANSAQWALRVKSPIIFREGIVAEMGILTAPEINSLIALSETNSEIASLVDRGFRQLNKNQKFSALSQKANADMFVCLKNIFANQSLDTILLTEFDQLGESSRENYRYVAALEAIGMRVHRQLLIRMLNLSVQEINTILECLSGIVDEYEINARDGVYGWRTRHLVIARKITEYKFSEYDALEVLFDQLIDNLNPLERIELHSIRDLCDTTYGIGRLPDSEKRQRLYRRLIDIAPAERIPRHRLIRELLHEEDLREDLEYVIRDAEEAVGIDAPLARFEVRFLVARAEKTRGIAAEDRVALLRRAYEKAHGNTGRYHWDKYSYRTLCDVAVQLVKRGGSPYLLDEAIKLMRDAADRIADPEMDVFLRQYEDIRARH
jgi:hypothetical protein